MYRYNVYFFILILQFFPVYNIYSSVIFIHSLYIKYRIFHEDNKVLIYIIFYKISWFRNFLLSLLLISILNSITILHITKLYFPVYV